MNMRTASFTSEVAGVGVNVGVVMVQFLVVVMMVALGFALHESYHRQNPVGKIGRSADVW